MPERKTVRTYVWLLVLCVTIVGVPLCLSIVMSSAQEQSQESDDGLPTADYDAPGPADKAEREKREKKGRKHDKGFPPVNPSPDVITMTASDHWFYGLPSLPVAQSSVVIIGEVTDANAYLSPGKTGVYSEFRVRVDEVLKTDDPAIVQGCTVDAERYGGKVRLPSGHVQKYTIISQGMPRVGRKYALFLRRYQGDLQILTGYELRQNKVRPLDSVRLFEVYKDATTQNFLEILRQAIVSPPPPPGSVYALPAD